MDNDFDVIRAIGRFGIYHGIIILLAAIRAYPMAWSNMMSPLMAADVPHWCAPPNETMDATWWRDNGVPKTPQGKPVECLMYQWSHESGINMNATVICSNGWSYDKTQFGETATSEWNLVCGDSWKRSAMQSIIMAGAILGVVVFAKISDNLGRRVAFISGICLLLSTGLSAAFVQDFLVFNILRFLMSSGASGITVATTALFMEIMPIKDRIYMNVGFGMGYSIPQLLIPLLSHSFRNFRYMQLAIGLTGFALLPFLFVLEESPKWLLAKHRLSEAKGVIVRILKLNRRPIPNMEHVMAELAVRAESENAKKNSNLGFIDLFKVPALRRNTLHLAGLWFSCAVTSYYLAVNAHRLPGNAHLNFAISTFVGLPSALVGMYLLRKCRRRQSVIFNTVTAALLFSVVFFLDDSYQWTKVYGTTIVRFFVVTEFIINWTNVHEINPTPARSAGFAVCMLFSRVGGMIAPFLKDIGDWTHYSVVYVVFMILSALGVFCIIGLPETLNKKLPDTIEDVKRLKGDTVKVGYEVEMPLSVQ